MADIRSHTRINDIFLGPLERPALKWLAAHMPAWVTPDHLTGIGVIGALVIFSGYCLSTFDSRFLWLASLGFVINWFGDSLDGTLARYRKIERPRYGFFIDHVVDAYNEALVFFGLGLSPFVSFGIACLALIGYLLMSVLVYVSTCVSGEFRISYGKLGPTEMRAIAILTNTLVYFTANPAVNLIFFSLSLFDMIVLAIAILLFAIFIVSSIRQGRQLANIDQVSDPLLPGKAAPPTKG